MIVEKAFGRSFSMVATASSLFVNLDPFCSKAKLHWSFATSIYKVLQSIAPYYSPTTAVDYSVLLTTERISPYYNCATPNYICTTLYYNRTTRY